MSRATFKQAIEKMVQHSDVKLLSVNQNMVEIASATKKKSPFVKVAVTDELAQGLMHRNRVAFIVHIDGDLMDEIVKRIEEELAQSAPESTESA